MTEVFLRPPSDHLLVQLAENLEPADAEELKAMRPEYDLVDILRSSVAVSFECYVAVIEEEPVAVFGIAIVNESGSMGAPWAVFTPSMRKYPRLLHAVSKGFIARWQCYFPTLSNFVDQNNQRAIKWLEHLGFIMVEEIKAAFGKPFYRFEWTNV